MIASTTIILPLDVFDSGHIVKTIGTNREENFSTKCAPSLKASRLPPAHVHQGWPSSHSEPPPSRSVEAVGLIEPLRSRASFAVLAKHGRRRQGRWCWVRFAPRQLDQSSPDAPDVSEIGYAIGKKVGNAVVRNRIRRRLRPIIAAAAADGSEAFTPGIYLVGVKSDQAAWIAHEELREDLLHTLAAAARARR